MYVELMFRSAGPVLKYMYTVQVLGQKGLGKHYRPGSDCSQRILIRVCTVCNFVCLDFLGQFFLWKDPLFEF